MASFDETALLCLYTWILETQDKARGHQIYFIIFLNKNFLILRFIKVIMKIFI